MARRRTDVDRVAVPGHPGSEYQVFISHATADKWIARTLCEKLEAAGASTFRDDRDIKGGDVIPAEIFRQIRQSREFVVLLTPASLNRPWILLELGAACGCDPPPRIITLRYHVETDAVPSIIQAIKGYHLNELDQYLADLSRRVELSREPTRPSNA